LTNKASITFDNGIYLVQELVTATLFTHIKQY